VNRDHVQSLPISAQTCRDAFDKSER